MTSTGVTKPSRYLLQASRLDGELPEKMFAGLGLAGLVFAILLKRADAREGGVLERSTT